MGRRISMKKAVVGIIAIAALVDARALAADMVTKAPPPPRAPVFTWSGCYAGADVGYAWQRDKDDEFSAATGAPDGSSPPATHPNGIKGGGYLGCNWQIAPTWVVGLEGDAEGADVDHYPGHYFLAPFGDFYESRTHFQGSVRGRVGYVVNNWLLYVTGGAAFANIQDHYVGLEPTGITTNVTDTRSGWTLGAGWEYAFTNNWIGRIEYRHADFGSVTNNRVFFCTVCGAANERHQTTEEALRLGISYKFSGPI